jgi:enoyl-CoA hydratase
MKPAMTQLLSYQRTRSITTITLDDGKLNVMSLPMLDALNEALDQAQWDQAVVVLAGRTGVFSAGFDLPLLRASNAESARMVREGFALAERLFAFPFPVVIGCTGHALAMGAFLVLAGDYRVGAEGPFKIGVNEVAIGITMPRFGAELCRERLLPTHFSRAVLNSEIYGPDDATTAGFLDETVAAQDVVSTAQLVAERLSALDMTAYAATKQRVREQTMRVLRHAIDSDRGDLAACVKPAVRQDAAVS